MEQKRRAWWPLENQGRKRAQEPGAALFQGLRVRLTLWYCAVLGVALVLFCVILYLSARYFFLTPVDNDVVAHAGAHVEEWRTNPNPYACLSGGPPGSFDHPSYNDSRGTPELIACYDRHGNLIQGNTTSQLPAAFLTNTLAKTALSEGKAKDTINAGGTTGLIERYAVAMPDPDGNGYMGVVMAGSPVGPQTNALSILLILLLSVGSLTLLGAGLGGLFLANRALAPAHLAFTRQQRFLADASHELRTPLTLMRADAEVLLRGRQRMEEEDAVLLEDIIAEANHMSILATSMLTLARLDANPQHREHEVINLNALAQASVQRVAAFAQQKGVTVEQQPSDDALTIGDPTLLEQAVLVLLDNAIKYNRAGGTVSVHTSISKDQAGLEIIDTGIGIPPEHLPHLSERFYRVDKARSREAGGAGLGLSIAHGIATLHQGNLTLTSVVDQGTTATLLLPLASPSPAHSRVKSENAATP